MCSASATHYTPVIDGEILPYFDLPFDAVYLPMPRVQGVSQTNRSELYFISNGLYRAATTPETFWLFVDEKTNLWHEAVSHGNHEAAMRLSRYYSSSLRDEVLALKWLAAALALGNFQAARSLEVRHERSPNLLAMAFRLSDDQYHTLITHVHDNRDWRAALRLALYYGFTKHSHKNKVLWLQTAHTYGLEIAQEYITLLNASHPK